MAAEILSRVIRALVAGKKVLPFSKLNHCPVILHLAYADDTIIFTNDPKNCLLHLTEFLARYEKESGQLINKSKSRFVVGSKVYVAKSNTVAACTSFLKKTMPLKYLMCTLFIERKKIEYFIDILPNLRKIGWVEV